MPYKDPERQRQANREAQARQRAKKRKAKEQRTDEIPTRPPKGPEVGPPDVIHWIENKLVVPTGPLIGQHMAVPPYMAEFIQAGLEPQTFEAAQSIARKNAKTGVTANICLAGVAKDGPLNRRQWRGVVTSLTGPLAGELKSAMQLTADASGLRGLEFLRSPTPGLCRGAQGSQINFLAADKATGHAIGADLAVIDETGLLGENKRPLVNAILSCISGRDGKLLHISIKGDGPFLPELERRRNSPGVYFVEYAADRRAALFDQEEWHAANPGLAVGIKSLNYMRQAAERAEQSPRNENYFRAYDLNNPLSPDTSPIVSLTDWLHCQELPRPPRQGRPVVGLDLGGEQAMSAAFAAWETGRVEVWAAFPSMPSIEKREKEDEGTEYRRWVRDGHLRVYPGALVPVQEFYDDIAKEIGPARIVGMDRYRKKELDHAPPGWPLDYRGGSASTQMAADIRAFQLLTRGGWFRPGPQPVLEYAIGESDVTETLRADSPLVLNKKAKNSRIDTLSAGIICAGYARQLWFNKTQGSGGGYHGVAVRGGEDADRETSVQ